MLESNAGTRRIYDQINDSFKGVYKAYQRGDYDSSRVQTLYGLVKPNAARLADRIGEYSAGLEYSSLVLFSASSLEFRIQENRGTGGILERITARPRVARLGDLVEFYHYLAGITTMDGEPKPTHGFANPKPTLLDLTVADYFYQRGLKTFSKFLTGWVPVEAYRRLAISNSSDETSNVHSEVKEDNVYAEAFMNATKTIALLAWHDFSKRTDIADYERAIALQKVEAYKAEIAEDKEQGEFDSGLVRHPERRSLPSLIGKIPFSPEE